jgi:hypothetical protein
MSEMFAELTPEDIEHLMRLLAKTKLSARKAADQGGADGHR